MIVLGMVLLAAFEYFRRSEADAPGWLFLVVLVFAPIGIWIDIKSRRDEGQRAQRAVVRARRRVNPP